MSKIIVISSDNKKYEATKEMLMLSGFLKELVEDNEDDQEVKLEVDSKYLEDILEFLKYQSTPGNDILLEFEQPIKSKKLEENIKVKFYVDFMNKLNTKGQEHVKQFTLQANFLNIEVLLHLCCVDYATRIKGKTPEEIRELFGLPQPAPVVEEPVAAN